VLGLWTLRVSRGPGARTGELELASLSGPVDVLRDSLGIPHVWASSIEDALFAQGFLHASDRLWQMEQIRRVADGTLSELFGERALESDRFLRTFGMGRAAERGVEVLCAECRVRLEAYVGGVNAALAGWRGPLPPEFVALRARPDPWTLADLVALEKVMAWDLSEYDIGLLLADARRRGGDALLERVRPRSGPDDLTILGGAPRSEEPPRRPPSAPALSEALLGSARVPGLAREMLDGASAVRASNAWVVGGARSRSGKPLLANDMHLELRVPTLWYLMGLHAPGLDVVGMTLPGSAGVVAGHSTAVAWGFSNATVDDVDFFVERVDPSDSTRYLTPGGSEPFVVRTEQIRVRGRDEPVAIRVRETRHGPVVSDVDAPAGGDLLAVRWIAHDPATTPEGVLRMNTARSAAEFVAALRLFRDPHQNVVFADTAGTFGYWMAGRVPLRASGGPPLLPVPGWTDENEWVGELPFDAHPHVLDPAVGYVVTANNRQTHDSVAELITDGTWALPYRAERITELLEASTTHDARSLLAIQTDVLSRFGLRYRAAAAASFRAAGHPALADSLSAWDGATTTDRREPLLFHAWAEALRYRLARAAYGAEPGYFPREALDRQLAAGEVDDAMASEAAREAVERAGALAWGEAHPLTLAHPLGAVPALATTLGFASRSFPVPGDPFTVNVASHGGRSPPFTVTHGPSQRHVVDLGDLDAGGFVLPGGQSGLPRSAHAFDQMPRWLGGELVPMPLSREAVEARTVSRLRLVPSAPTPRP
jgi:penicillin amidase